MRISPLISEQCLYCAIAQPDLDEAWVCTCLFTLDQATQRTIKIPYADKVSMQERAAEAMKSAADARKKLAATAEELLETKERLVAAENRVAAAEIELVTTRYSLAETEKNLVPGELVSVKQNLVEAENRAVAAEQELVSTKEKLLAAEEKAAALEQERDTVSFSAQVWSTITRSDDTSETRVFMLTNGTVELVRERALWG